MDPSWLKWSWIWFWHISSKVITAEPIVDDIDIRLKTEWCHQHTRQANIHWKKYIGKGHSHRREKEGPQDRALGNTRENGNRRVDSVNYHQLGSVGEVWSKPRMQTARHTNSSQLQQQGTVGYAIKCFGQIKQRHGEQWLGCLKYMILVKTNWQSVRIPLTSSDKDLTVDDFLQQFTADGLEWNGPVVGDCMGAGP